MEECFYKIRNIQCSKIKLTKIKIVGITTLGHSHKINIDFRKNDFAKH